MPMTGPAALRVRWRETGLIVWVIVEVRPFSTDPGLKKELQWITR
jgi:hypothetical protein